MRSRLRILKPEKVKSGSGGEKLVWTEIKVVYAQRVKASGSNSLELGEHFPDYRPEFNIRDAHEIEENWRVEEVGGKEYIVSNIIPNREKGYLTLKCDRVNK